MHLLRCSKQCAMVSTLLCNAARKWLNFTSSKCGLNNTLTQQHLSRYHAFSLLRNMYGIERESWRCARWKRLHIASARHVRRGSQPCPPIGAAQRFITRGPWPTVATRSCEIDQPSEWSFSLVVVHYNKKSAFLAGVLREPVERQAKRHMAGTQVSSPRT